MYIWYSIYYIYCTFTNHIYVEQLSKRYQRVFIKSEYLRHAGSTNQKTVPTTPNQDFRVLTSSMYNCQYNFPPWLQPSHGCKTRLFSGSNLLQKTEGGGHSPTLRNPYDRYLNPDRLINSHPLGQLIFRTPPSSNETTTAAHWVPPAAEFYLHQNVFWPSDPANLVAFGWRWDFQTFGV